MATTRTDYFNIKFLGEGGSGNLVQGHHGITASRVSGIVRVHVSPDFTLAHTNISTRPALDLFLTGTQRTSVNNIWVTTELVNDGVSVTDPLEPGLVRDEETYRLRTLLPGTYDVPFSIPLADDLPPSFSSADVTVAYTLSAKFRFREMIGENAVVFFRTESQEVPIRKYHPDHIINTKDALRKRPSIPFNEFSQNDSDDNDSSINSDEVGKGGIGQLGRDFLEPISLSNAGSEDAVQYTVKLPSRSFGPDDLVSANLHIDRLPDGFAVHHVEMIVEAEIVTQVNGVVNKSRQVLLKHTDTPTHAAHYWNRDIQARLFHAAASPSVPAADASTNESDRILRPGSADAEQVNDPDEGFPTEQPPVFNDLQQRFTVPADFEQRPIARQRSDLLEAMHGSRSNSLRATQSSNALPQNVAVAQDAGFAAGSSSTFMPWMVTRRESKESISSMHDNIIRRTLSGDLRLLPFRSMSTPASRPSLRASSSTIGVNRQPSPHPPIPPASNNVSSSMLDGENLRVPLLIVQSENDGLNQELGGPNTQQPPLTVAQVHERSRASFEMTTPEPDTDSNRLEFDNEKEEHNNAPLTPESHSANGRVPQPASTIENSHDGVNPRYDAYMLPRPLMRPAAILRAVNSHGSATSLFGDTARGDTAVAAEPGSLEAGTGSNTFLPSNPLKSVIDKITGVPTIEAAESTLKPLTSFVAPTLSVRHTLRIEIICHKPLPMNMGSQLMYLPPSRNSSMENLNESDVPKPGTFKSFFKRNLPVGFRHRTVVETPVLVHHANETDRQFLQGYLYGPQGAGAE
ncbi:hypothetical protein HDU80_008328 [Chytriomyces hyalinus]|nr:hypothetical protein HDU80_008328 [Chytriomyces hyalinus]